MTLANHLIAQGLVTGPLPSTSNTSNSGMGAAKTFLLGQEPFQGDELFLVFGRVLHDHLQHIEDLKYRSAEFYSKLTEEEQGWILGCCNAARENPIVKRLLIKTVREQKLYVEIGGIRLALILDLEQEHVKTGSDWKSSSCKTLSEFIKKAILYDYIRQGLLYKTGRGLKHFYFIGLQKRPPHQVYIMDVKQHPAEEFYAAQEIKFLLYFYRKYGKPVIAGQASIPTKQIEDKRTKQIYNMAVQTKGKEALAAIAAQHKAVKASHKQWKKDVAQFNKLVNKFPAKERDLYAEKLEAFDTEETKLNS